MVDLLAADNIICCGNRQNIFVANSSLWKLFFTEALKKRTRSMTKIIPTLFVGLCVSCKNILNNSFYIDTLGP